MLLKRQKEKALNRLDYRLFRWRRVRDSNPRAISLATRFRVELVMTTSITLRVYFNPIFSPKNHSKNFWGEKQGRKQKNIRFLILKTRYNQGFPANKTNRCTKNFECCTFDHSDNSPYSILHFLLARIILSNILCFVNKNLRQTEKTVCRRVLIKKAFYKLRYCVYRYFIA